MAIDYSPFLHVLEDGTIWWPLTDAVKLGAGYLPLRDDDCDLNPVLRAKYNRVRADERTLFSEFSPNHYTHAHPRLLERDGGRLVEATEFLDWLSNHLATQTQSTIVFPADLASAVRKAKGAADFQASVPPFFDSMTIALEGWFDRPLAELPDALRQRAEREMSPIPWDHMTAVQRRTLALQVDYRHDPAAEQGRKFWWDFFQRMDSLKKQIAQWDATATPTAGELALKEARLKELRQELARMDTQRRQDRGDYYPERNQTVGDGKTPTPSADLPVQYVAYPKAMHQLTKRLGATPEELAAWIWQGPKDGGITAYMNANELDPPPRFHFNIGGTSHDYVQPLMSCWFRADEIDQFEPADRYIIGTALIERWSKVPGVHAVAFIQAKIAESRLQDIHPIYGGTQGTFSEHSDWPPLTSGLFSLSEVELIELEDFAAEVQGEDPSGTTGSPTNPDGIDGHGSVAQGAAGGHCSVFLSMKNLNAGELSMAFVGDRAESGLGANNMLEVSARKEIRRIALAALDLVDRRKGGLNSQGLILLGMTQRKRLTHSTQNAAKMKRLRDVFRKHFGVNDDPFERYRKDAGWVPRFKISDKRGAADERAKREAERRTDSYEQLNERGDRFAAHSQSQHPLDDIDEDDQAQAWLRDNDPEASA